MTSIDKKYSMPSILYYTSITWYIVDCIYVRDIRQAFYAINHLSDLFTNVTWKAIRYCHYSPFATVVQLFRGGLLEGGGGETHWPVVGHWQTSLHELGYMAYTSFWGIGIVTSLEIGVNLNSTIIRSRPR